MFRKLASALVAELIGLRDGLDVILDDYQIITEVDVHRAVSFLLDHLPPAVHLVVSSRVDPPLPLARLRAQGEMVRIGASELAFTEEEARSFLRGVMELDLSRDEVASLEQKTEGWVAGLQLAALSMRDRSDISGFVASFSGTHRDVLDFLTEEVLTRQPADVREFLLRTSVLDGLTGSLCDSLTGRFDGQRMLERLEKENLFLVAADDERRWFRYHHLFAAFLRSRLVEQRRDLASQAHRRAADWYEARGHVADAIGHTLAAPDYERAVQLSQARRERRGAGARCRRCCDGCSPSRPR